MTISQSGHPTEAPRGGGLGHILDILRRRRVLAVLPALLVVTAAVSVAVFLPSVWKARAVILVDQQQIPEEFVRPTVTGDIGSQLITLSQEILSRPRLARIIDDLNLYPAQRATHSAEDLVDRMRRDIRIDFLGADAGRRGRGRDGRTISFGVAFTATDPLVAATVANGLAELYVAENVRYRERQAVGTSEFLEVQLNEMRRRLQEQERKVADYKEGHMGELPQQLDANLRTVERLQQQLQLAHERHRRAGEQQQALTQTLAEIERAGIVGETGAPGVTPADATAGRLALLREELVQLEARYTDRYPDVIHLREQVRALEERLAAERAAEGAVQPAAATGADAQRRVFPQNTYVASLMQQLENANIEIRMSTAEIARLDRAIAEYQRRIENTPRREQELALITREYETTRDMFRSMLAKRGQAEIAADLEHRQKGEHFRIIEAATVPDRPVGPNRMRLLLIGVIMALGASALAVVLAEQVDTSYRTVDELRGTTPVPVLSTIPRITTADDRARRMRQQRLATVGVALAMLAVVGSSFAVARNNYPLVGIFTPPERPGMR
jgi:polysaccharide biosynthesis transport protein